MGRKIHCHASLASSNFSMGRAHHKAARCGSHPTIWQQERHYGTVVLSMHMAHESSLCFRPKIPNIELAAIKNFRQASSVDDYEEQFLMLVCRCEGLTEAHHVELFVAGLHKSIRTDVKLMYPTVLEDGMDMPTRTRSVTHRKMGIPLSCPRGTPV
jgi:hypothetical protein